MPWGASRRARSARCRGCCSCPTSPTRWASLPWSPASSCSCPRPGTSSSTRSPGGSATGHASPSGRRRPFLLKGGLALAVVLRAAVRRPDRPAGRRRRWVVVRVPRVRHGVRVLPGALRRDAGRDDRRLRRTHPADDVARRGAGAGDPASAGRPRPRSATRSVAGAGLPRRWASYVAVLLAHRRPRRVARHPRRPGAPRRDRRRASLRDQLRSWLGGADFRLLLTTFVLQALGDRGDAGRGRLRRRGTARHEPAASTILFAASSRPALLVTPLWQRSATRRGKKSGYLRRVAAARRSGALVLVCAGTCRRRARLRRRGHRGHRLRRAPRCSRWRCCPTSPPHDAAHPGENRVGVFTGRVDRRRDARPGARTRGVRAGARARRLRVVDGPHGRAARRRARPRSRSASRSCPRC